MYRCRALVSTGQQKEEMPTIECVDDSREKPTSPFAVISNCTNGAVLEQRSHSMRPIGCVAFRSQKAYSTRLRFRVAVLLSFLQQRQLACLVDSNNNSSLSTFQSQIAYSCKLRRSAPVVKSTFPRFSLACVWLRPYLLVTILYFGVHLRC